MTDGHAGLIKVAPGFDSGEVEVTLPSGLVEPFEEALDEAGIEHERPLVHGAPSDVVIVVLRLVAELTPQVAEIINAYLLRHKDKEVHWDGRTFQAKGYSAEDILKFMNAASAGDA